MDNEEKLEEKNTQVEVLEEQTPIPEGISEDKKQKKEKKNKKDSKLKEENEKLLEQIQQLQVDNQSLIDKVNLTQAELVNYRKRKDPREGVIEKPLDLAACHFVCHCRPVAFSGKCKPGKPDQHYDTDQAIRMYCDDPCG